MDRAAQELDAGNGELAMASVSFGNQDYFWKSMEKLSFGI
jgi:hypothetical protein